MNRFYEDFSHTSAFNLVIPQEASMIHQIALLSVSAASILRLS